MPRSGSDCSIVVMKRSNFRGAKGAGHPRQDGVNGQPEELLVLPEGAAFLGVYKEMPTEGQGSINSRVEFRCSRELMGTTQLRYSLSLADKILGAGDSVVHGALDEDDRDIRPKCVCLRPSERGSRDSESDRTIVSAPAWPWRLKKFSNGVLAERYINGFSGE
jgi:hypothetical protein